MHASIGRALFCAAMAVTLSAHFAEAQTHPIVVHSNQRVASVQMTSAEYASWKNNDDYDRTPIRQALIKDLYQIFNDEFDFVILVLNEAQQPPNFGYAGASIGVSNQVTGLGGTTYNVAADYGSGGRLKSVIHMSRQDGISGGPILHEVMHTWGNYGIPTANFENPPGAGYMPDYRPHWGFTGGNTLGQLGGFIQDSLVANVGGKPNRYSAGRFLSNINGVNTIPYRQMELYLMGMIPLSEVAPFDVFRDITAFDGYPRPAFEFEADTRIRYDNARILAELGARSPSSLVSQKDFRALIAVICAAPLTEAEWNAYDKQSEEFGRPASENTYNYNFWEATGGRGTLETGKLNNAVKGSSVFRLKRPGPTLVVLTPDGLYNLLGRHVPGRPLFTSLAKP